MCASAHHPTPSCACSAGEIEALKLQKKELVESIADQQKTAARMHSPNVALELYEHAKRTSRAKRAKAKHARALRTVFEVCDGARRQAARAAGAEGDAWPDHPSSPSCPISERTPSA